MTRKEFSRYVTTQYQHLYRFVRSRIPSDQDAEDVLQKALLRLLLRCDSIHPLHPDGLFFTALRNATIDYWRHRGRRPTERELHDQVAERSVDGPSCEDGVALDAFRTVVRRAVANLTERERRAFTAYWRCGGERFQALEELGVAQAGKAEAYRVYDGPLYHARRKLMLALVPSGPALADVAHGRLWRLILEVLDGSPPGNVPEGGAR